MQRESAMRWYDLSFTCIPKYTERFARRYGNEPSPEFSLTLPCSSMIHPFFLVLTQVSLKPLFKITECTQTHMYTHVHIHTHTHTQTYLYIHIHLHAHAHINTFIYPYPCTYANTCTYTCTYVYVYMHVIMHQGHNHS